MNTDQKCQCPKVSILIAAFNEEATIHECLMSVLEQTETRIEIVLIDDGSTDRTLEIARQIKDPRLRIINKHNEGLVIALNYGLKLCRGSLVARLDADDVSDPTRIKKQLKCFEDDHSLVLCGTWSITKNHQRLSGFCPPSGEIEIRRKMTHDNQFVHSSVMYRRGVVQKIGGYKNIRPCEDYDLWIRLANEGRIAIIPEPLVTRKEDRNFDTRAFYTGLSRANIYKARLLCQIQSMLTLGVSPTAPLAILMTALKIPASIIIKYASLSWGPEHITRREEAKTAQVRNVESPLVSVIIPLHNDRKNICNAVAGILGQNYQPLEVIVVDDGSTDGGSSLVESTFSTKVKILRKSQGGVSSALNFGIKHAKGSIIAINDSDDVSHKDRIKNQVQELLSDEKIACLGTSAITYDDAGTVVLLNLMPTENKEIQRIKFRTNPFVHSSMMYHKTAYERSGGYNEAYKTMQDYDLWLSMLDWGCGKNLNEVYVRRTQRPESHTRIPRSLHYWRSASLKYAHFKLNRRCLQALYGAALDATTAGAAFLAAQLGVSVRQTNNSTDRYLVV
jgi:glycosyltransferase involved in cell wall biosynthesis